MRTLSHILNDRLAKTIEPLRRLCGPLLKRGIAVRIAVIFSGLLLLATATAGYMVYQEASTSLIKISTERLGHTAEVIRVRTLASIEAVTKDVRFLASTPPVQGIVRARTRRGLDPETALFDTEWRDQLRDIFTVFLENRPSFVSVSFIDLRSTPQALVTVDQRANRPDTGLEAVANPLSALLSEDAALTPGTVYLSDIEVVNEDGLGRIPLMRGAMPIFQSDGRLFGAVTVSIDLRDLLTNLTSIVGADKSLFVANNEGILLATSDGPFAMEQDLVAAGSHIDDIFPMRTVHSGNIHFVELGQVDGSARMSGLAYFGPLPYDTNNDEHQIRLAVVSPNSVILEAVNDVEKRSVLIVVFFSLLGGLIALALSRFLTLPLSSITDALSRFGEQGWDVELPTSRPDEIGILARAFDKMAAHIRYQVGVLEDNERHQRTILETAAEGIVVVDRNGLIENFNSAAERLFGLAALEVTGEHIATLLSPTIDNRTQDPAESVTPWRNVGTGHEVVGRRKGGTEFQASLAVSEFVFEKEIKYTLFLQDISERKEYETALRVAKEKAEEMAQLKTAFLANMSHELRTPLTAVIGYAAMLADELSEHHEQFAQLIQRSGRRLMDTLNAVLSLAQLEAQQANVELDLLNVAREVDEAAEFFATHADNKGLAFRCICAPSSRGALARLDRGALNSVLQNLIGNAIKFTDSGFVEVRVRTIDEQVEIEIRDTGIGIDKSFLPHLFEAFRQESTGLHRSHEGSGLGLTLTKRLVDLMGGELRVESEKGSGTSFIVRFPKAGRQLYDAVGTDEDTATINPTDWTETQILVVEDNQETAFLVRKVLEAVGDVTLAFTGDEAVRKAARLRYDLVLCDISLGGGKSGVEVLHSLRADPAYENVPIVALTAFALPGDRDRFLKNGFDEYLSKPFTPNALLQHVSDMLHRSAERAKMTASLPWSDGEAASFLKSHPSFTA